MIWQPFVPAKPVKEQKWELPTIKMIVFRGRSGFAYINKPAQALTGWQSGRTFDLWLDHNTGGIGITVYAPEEKAQGRFVCGARGAKELTEALKAVGGEIGDVFPVKHNEDAQCNLVKFVARVAKDAEA